MTDHLTPGIQDQIEAHLSRALEGDELVTVMSLDELNAQQSTVVETLARRHRLAALLYLRGVVDNRDRR